MREEYLMNASLAMNVPLSREQAEKMVCFHEKLMEANTRMNLTRVGDDFSEAADRNYLDSIAPAAYFPKNIQSMVDVGTGAGFPGVPIAILRPDIAVTLMDSLGKRVEFLRGVVEELCLNAVTVHIRAEDAGHDAAYREKFDMAVSRAVAGMNVLCEYDLPLVKKGGWMFALKGPNLDEELPLAEKAIALLGGRLIGQKNLVIPNRDWDHRLAIIEKIAPTAAKYPRKAGMPERKPL